MMKIARRLAIVIVACAAGLVSEPSNAQKPSLPHILPEALETELALSAAPLHLQDGAAVLRNARQPNGKGEPE